MNSNRVELIMDRSDLADKLDRVEKILNAVNVGEPTYSDLTNYCMELSDHVVSLVKEMKKINEKT